MRRKDLGADSATQGRRGWREVAMPASMTSALCSVD